MALSLSGIYITCSNSGSLRVVIPIRIGSASAGGARRPAVSNASRSTCVKSRAMFVSAELELGTVLVAPTAGRLVRQQCDHGFEPQQIVEALVAGAEDKTLHAGSATHSLIASARLASRRRS